MIAPSRGSSFVRRRQSSTRNLDAPDDGEQAPTPARRRFGQNFLVDASAIRRIVAALAPAPGETVLEIGPGRGAMTDALLTAVDSIVAVEIDRDLARQLRERFPADRLRLIERDILEVPLASLRTEGPLVVAGNLPYNISKPCAMKLCLERRDVARAVLMFQREVADRLSAAPGTKEYGPLTVLCGRAFRIERLFDLAPGCFRPSPKVVSTVTRWTPREAGALPEALIAPLRAVLRAAFAHRRQTLSKNFRGALAGGEAAARSLLQTAGIDGALRAERIEPDGFLALARAWPEAPHR
jgi:16S rRNA (adenine1518-N6/adenine1519-N6)-dimethyltransferase